MQKNLLSTLSRISLFLCLTLFGGQSTFSQTVFWSEDFESLPCAGGDSDNCRADGLTSVNGTWNVTTTGTNGPASNIFFISCTENGCGVGACDAACGACPAGTNYTLHVANDKTSPNAAYWCAAGDCGAAYDAGGIAPSPATSKRMETPKIDCSGRTTITLSFEFIAGGAPPNDAFDLYYFDGSTWSVMAASLQSNSGSCGAQRQWTLHSVALPASANNNADVKIGFEWHNDNDGAGADPSFAVDNIKLTVAGPLEIELSKFVATPTEKGIQLMWQTANEGDAESYSIERSSDSESFVSLEKKEAIGGVNGWANYEVLDPAPSEGVNFYRVKEVSKSGIIDYSNTLAVFNGQDLPFEIIAVNHDKATGSIAIKYACNAVTPVQMQILDTQGKAINKASKDVFLAGTHQTYLDVSDLSSGIYFLKLKPTNMDGSGSIPTMKIILR